MVSGKFRSFVRLQIKRSSRRVRSYNPHRHRFAKTFLRHIILPVIACIWHESCFAFDALCKILITATVWASADEIKWENAAGLSGSAVVREKVCKSSTNLNSLLFFLVFYVSKKHSNRSPAWPKFDGWPSIPEQVWITSTKFASLGSRMKSVLGTFVKPGNAGSVVCMRKMKTQTWKLSTNWITDSFGGQVMVRSWPCLFISPLQLYPNQWFLQVCHCSGTFPRSPQCEHLLDYTLNFHFKVAVHSS